MRSRRVSAWDLAEFWWGLAECWWVLTERGWELVELWMRSRRVSAWDLAEFWWGLAECWWVLSEREWELVELWMRSRRISGWGIAYLRMRSSRVCMNSSRMFDGIWFSVWPPMRAFQQSCIVLENRRRRQMKQCWIKYIHYTCFAPSRPTFYRKRIVSQRKRENSRNPGQGLVCNLCYLSPVLCIGKQRPGAM